MPASRTRSGSEGISLNLLSTYEVALDELRSWRDPAVAGLITRLEALRRQAQQERRYSELSRRAASRLGRGA